MKTIERLKAEISERERHWYWNAGYFEIADVRALIAAAEALQEFIRLDEETGLACNDGGELVSALHEARAAQDALK